MNEYKSCPVFGIPGVLEGCCRACKPRNSSFLLLQILIKPDAYGFFLLTNLDATRVIISDGMYREVPWSLLSRGLEEDGR